MFSRVVCPKCHSKTLCLTECGEWYGQYEQIDGVVINREEGQMYPGKYFRLDAVCECGHRWRVRNAIQITCVEVKSDIVK